MSLVKGNLYFFISIFLSCTECPGTHNPFWHQGNHRLKATLKTVGLNSPSTRQSSWLPTPNITHQQYLVNLPQRTSLAVGMSSCLVKTWSLTSTDMGPAGLRKTNSSPYLYKILSPVNRKWLFFPDPPTPQSEHQRAALRLLALFACFDF